MSKDQKKHSTQTEDIPPQKYWENSIGETYETRRLLYSLALPLMWILTVWVIGKKALWKRMGREIAVNSLWFDGLSETCRRIKEGAASWIALDLIYNHPFGTRGRLTDFWLGMRNAQGVRNRKRLVVFLLVDNLRRLAENGQAHLLSLASGSAQSVIEALVILKQEGIHVDAVLVDIDPEALNHSMKLARLHGVGDQIIAIEGDLRDLLRLERTLAEYQPFHVIEMVGLLEYVKDKAVVKLIQSARSVLAPKGVFLTASITHNPEQWFLHWVIQWKMIYRKTDSLLQLLVKAGFSHKSCKIFSEPHDIFHVAVCST